MSEVNLFEKIVLNKAARIYEKLSRKFYSQCAMKGQFKVVKRDEEIDQLETLFNLLTSKTPFLKQSLFLASVMKCSLDVRHRYIDFKPAIS